MKATYTQAMERLTALMDEMAQSPEEWESVLSQLATAAPLASERELWELALKVFRGPERRMDSYQVEELPN